MCTVTFIPLDNQNFVFTNNRDEAPDRETLNPSIYSINDIDTLFPSDKRAGGTWLGLSGKNRLVCVLNGGFTFHERRPNYRKSRGVVVKELLVSNHILEDLKSYDYTDIEPFTLIVLEYQNELRLYELVWDGDASHFKQLPIVPKIWSSSSLYSETMKEERKTWFETYKSLNNLKAESVLQFHHEAGQGNDHYGIIMDRFFVRTTSISQIEKTQDKLHWRYENLQSQDVTNYSFDIAHQLND